MNNKGFLYFICSVSAMGGLLFGYDWVVIGGAKPFYEQFFSIAADPVMQGVAMTTALIGCLIGAMVAGAAADRYGRKPLLILSAVLFTVSAIATGAFNDFTLFNIARFIGGVGIGVASALSPMYIAEVSPANISGRMVSLNQMTIVLGILSAQIVNMLIGQGVSDEWGTQMAWRWMFWAETVPAAAFLIMSFFIPESPVFLRLKSLPPSPSKGGGDINYPCCQSQQQNIYKSPTPLEGVGGRLSPTPLEGVGGMSLVTEDSGNQQKSPLRGDLGGSWSSGLRSILFLGLFIAVFQQWCGTNVIFNYAQEIFIGAGFDVDGMFINIVITGIANVLFTFVALYTVEKWGRRTLMLLGSGGLGVIYLILGTCYYMHVTGVMMVVLVVAAISCYAMTLGTVTWVLLSEIFPHRVRGVAMATCTFALWVGCCTLTFSFPVMNASLGSYGSFWIYSAICLVGFLVFLMRLPETKGKSLEQLEEELTNHL